MDGNYYKKLTTIYKCVSALLAKTQQSKDKGGGLFFSRVRFLVLLLLNSSLTTHPPTHPRNLLQRYSIPPLVFPAPAIFFFAVQLSTGQFRGLHGFAVITYTRANSHYKGGLLHGFVVALFFTFLYSASQKDADLSTDF